MGISNGLLRLGQVIDWVCCGIAALIAAGVFGAMVFENSGAAALLFLGASALFYGLGKAARYIINGFAK